MKLEKMKFMLLAQDMERAVAFYTGVFALRSTMVSSHWSELQLGDAILALHGGGDGELNVTGLSLQVDDAAAACAAIEAGGGCIVTAPAQKEGEPVLLGRFTDPEGNEVMLTQYVGL